MFKKLFLVFAFSVFLVSGATITKSYTFYQEPVIKDGRVYMKDCHFRYTHFAPSVVERPVILLLPKGEEAVSIDVEYSGKILLDGEFDLKPILPGTRISAPRPERSFFETRSEVYKQNSFYPEQRSSNWFNTQYKCGHALLYSSVNPVQYNPVTRQIQYFKSIKVTVHTQATRNSSYDDFYACSPSINSELESMVDNPEAVADLTYTAQDGKYEYLIITTEAMKDSWDKFIAFNMRRGLRTKVVSATLINSTGTGSDQQQKIRNYIKNEYAQNKPNLTYLMLGSDGSANGTTDCAVRWFGCEFWDHDQLAPTNKYKETDIPAEMYYECLDGEWKNSGDPYYGMNGAQDFSWELFSGRFTADNAAQLGSMIDKTVKYSETPVEAEVKNLFMAGTWIGVSNGVTVTGGKNIDNYLDTSTANGYTTIGFPTNEWNVQKLYEDTPDGWTIDQLRAGLKSHKPTILCHDGSSSSTYVWKENISGVTSANYPQDGGTAGNFMIAITGACLAGQFDRTECFFEAFAKLPTGFVATMSNTKTGWADYDGTDGCSNRPVRFMWDGLFNPVKQFHHLGRLLTHGKEANADIMLNTDLNTPPYYYCLTYAIYETVLMGDPALSVWTKTPGTMQANYPTPLSGTTFTWETGQPYTWVALCTSQDSIIATQLTGKDGKCALTSAALAAYIGANPGGTLKVRAKAHNYKPFEGALQIGSTDILNNNNVYKFVSTFNTCSGKTNISYLLPKQGMVNIALYNVKGLMLGTIKNGYQNAGQHNVTFNCSDLSNGVYYCKLSVGNKTINNKIVVSR